MANEVAHLRTAAEFFPSAGGDTAHPVVWRLRDRHVEEAARSIQHMQKSLTSMNVQLANAISDIGGVSGQAIIR